MTIIFTLAPVFIEWEGLGILSLSLRAAHKAGMFTDLQCTNWVHLTPRIWFMGLGLSFVN
jgi:hypothetical protein